MYALKIVTTVFIWILILVIFAVMRSIDEQNRKASIICFGFMETVYVLSLICMWMQ